HDGLERSFLHGLQGYRAARGRAPRPGEAAPGPGLRAVPQLGTTKVDVIDRPVSGLGAARLRGGRVCFSEEMTKIVSGVDWKRSGEYGDIVYETAEGIAKITINRPEVHNAFRPQTLFELQEAFNAARDDSEVGVVIFTGRSEEHTSELQSRENLVCRLLLENKKQAEQ